MSAPLEPVNAEDLALLRELDNARVNLSLRFTDLNIEHVQVLAAIKRVKDQQDAVFRRIASERGLPDQSLVEINPKTGEVIASPTSKSVPEAQVPVAEAAAPPSPEA